MNELAQFISYHSEFLTFDLRQLLHCSILTITYETLASVFCCLTHSRCSASNKYLKVFQQSSLNFFALTLQMKDNQ